ncbi:Slp family lipoprotein [Colwelliaceae bacterium 6441]
MLNRVCLLMFCLVITSGCVNIPQSLRVGEDSKLTNFSDVRDNNAIHLGELARWGGVIASVKNNADNTMLEVVHFQLKSSMRPQQKDQTQGRFKVYFQGFLDPVIYKEGRSITAVGHIADKEAGTIGEHEYEYPVLKAKNVHLWKEIKQVDVNVMHQPFWYNPSLWYSPRPFYRSPFYRSYATPKSKSGHSTTKNK